jgi:hypothetical protein
MGGEALHARDPLIVLPVSQGLEEAILELKL